MTQNQNNDWREGLSEEYRGDKALVSFGNLDDLAKSYISLSKKIGANTVVVPGKDATEYDREQFAIKALGRPEKEDGYELKKPDGVSDEKLAAFRKLAFENGISNGRAQKMLEGLTKYDTDAAEQARLARVAEAKEKFQQGHDALKQEWGGSNYEHNKRLANIAVTEFGGDDFVDLLKGHDLHQHPLLLKVFANIAKITKDDILPNEHVKGVRTKADAQAEYDRIMTDFKHPYWQGEGTALKQVERLLQEIHT